MEHHTEAFVALDTAKLRNAVAIADAGRNGEIAISARSTIRKSRHASSWQNSRANMLD